MDATGADRRVDRNRGRAHLESGRRDLLGPGRDHLGFGGGLRAHLSGDCFSAGLAARRRILGGMGIRDTTHDARALMPDAPVTYERADVHRVRDVLAKFPAQCRAAAELRPVPTPTFPRPRLVVVAGMGGSASSGDLLAGCAAERLDVPVIVHRGYGLPTLAGGRDLVIATSYSGDTAESLSAAEGALSSGCPLVSVPLGGRPGGVSRGRGGPSISRPAGQ